MQRDMQAAARRSWLRQAATAAGWRQRAAAIVLVSDGAGAIGFAAGLGGALGATPAGTEAAVPFVLLLMVSAAARGACAWGALRLGVAASGMVRVAVRRRAILACLDLRPGERANFGDKMTACLDATEVLDGYITRFLPARKAAAIVPALILAAAVVASPVSGAILAATLLPFIAIMALAGGAAADESRRQLTALARLSGLFADRVRALPVVLSFQAEGAEAGRLGGAADELRRRTMGVLRIAFVSSAGLDFFAALSVALVAVYVGFNLLGLLPFPVPEHLDLGRGVFVLALAPEFYAPMRRLAAAYHDRQAAETAADRLMALEALARPFVVAAPMLTAPPRIRFEAASVRYPGQDQAAVEELEFEAQPGELVALLGPSGAGKSTALNLLLGLAPLSGGEVWADGQALSVQGSFARSIAWMGQRPLILPGTIAENIALSDRGAADTTVRRVAERAGLCELLRRRGLDVRVDERGSGLSGGERRRIALARALLKPAPILLLDEPTAHLDALAELELLPVLHAAAQGRTTIIATHSAAVAAIADRVVRL